MAAAPAGSCRTRLGRDPGVGRVLALLRAPAFDGAVAVASLVVWIALGAYEETVATLFPPRRAPARRRLRPDPGVDSEVAPGTGWASSQEASMSKGTVIPPGAGERLDLYQLEVIFKVTAAETEGRFAAIEHAIRPGVLVKPHVHSLEDEVSIVLEGTVSARIGDEILRAEAGTYIVKPRGVPHALWNDGTASTRVIEIVSPAGFENYFRELAPILAGDSSNEVYRALAQRYGIRILDEWVEELETTYKVSL